VSLKEEPALVELHGWITLSESYEYGIETDNEKDNEEEIVAEIGKYIDDLDFQPDEVVLRYLNGTPHISISMYKNRITQEVENVFNLFQCVAEKAKGSYGLLYLYDTEDTDGKDNLFQVYVLARGAIKTTTDTFLSPLVPVVASMDWE